MVSLKLSQQLPDKNSSDLCLAQPTRSESRQIWTQSSSEWRDALSLSQYLEESEYLLTTSLAHNGTLWILVDKNEKPDQRRILSSCESFQKQTLFTNGENSVSEGFMHGIASVFTEPDFRGRGYGGRMMRELAVVLRTWQVVTNNCVGSILYSDIGKKYYTRFGWHPAPRNFHVEFPATDTSYLSSVRHIFAGDLMDLCRTDELLLRKRIFTIQKPCFAIIPDYNHMLWHHAKEEFDCTKLFAKVPIAKGAIIGEPGARMWIIWTHRYYENPEKLHNGNVLYILRFVVEGNEDDTVKLSFNNEREETQLKHLRALIQCAQQEASEWKLNSVKLWNPSKLILSLIEKMEINHVVKERQQGSIASLLWYNDEKAFLEESPLWIANEKYAWC